MTIQKSRFSSEAAPHPAGSQDEAGLAGMMDSIHRTASAFRRLPIFAIGLSEDARDGTMLAAGPTNPGSTTSESGHPQPTISGFFVPAIWATTPGKRTNEHNTHAERGGSVPAFAVWSRGPNKPARVNKARLLVEVVDAMPHPDLQHGRLTKPRESTGHDLHLPDPAFPYLPFGRPTPYPHHYRRC